MNKQFIKVNAFPCNENGEMNSGVPIRFEFELNSSFVAAFDGDKVILKDSNVINLDGVYYTDIHYIS